MPTLSLAARGPAFSLVVTLVAAVMAAGCGRPAPSPRRPLAGAVTVDGKAAFSGAVSFYPRAGHAGPVATAEIRAGRYAFSGTDGPTAGPHRAVVVFLADAAEAGEFAPRPGKGRRPEPDPRSPADTEDAAEPTAPATEPVSAPDPAAPPTEETAAAEAEPPVPAPPAPNMRAFDVEVPATDPPRLDFAIERGASP
jgi:hypothetical protein